MPPLRRIFSISAADLQTIMIYRSNFLSDLWITGRHTPLALDHLENLLGDLLDRQIAIDGNQPPFARVYSATGLVCSS